MHKLPSHTTLVKEALITTPDLCNTVFFLLFPPPPLQHCGLLVEIYAMKINDFILHL